ncbi:MAG: IclR family transcriptional regulator [Hyphomicrobiales bacterium]|nr:MAG: IclR family transcriptional regulator [Hyphomicrobiales bacterium]
MGNQFGCIKPLRCQNSANGVRIEIVETLDQSPATIHRILSTYEKRKNVEMDTATQEWFIGSENFRFGSAYLRRSGVVEHVRPFMRELMEETGETANLGTEVHGEVMFLSQVETHENIRAFFPPGTKSPMHASGIGKALLAHAEPSKIAKYLDREKLESFTTNTISSPAALQNELLKIKEQGYAFDNEEKSTGMRCVAASIFNSYGEVIAGLSISGPSIRLPLDRIDQIGKLVRVKAVLLSR